MKSIRIPFPLRFAAGVIVGVAAGHLVNHGLYHLAAAHTGIVDALFWNHGALLILPFKEVWFWLPLTAFVTLAGAGGTFAVMAGRRVTGVAAYGLAGSVVAVLTPAACTLLFAMLLAGPLAIVFLFIPQVWLLGVFFLPSGYVIGAIFWWVAGGVDKPHQGNGAGRTAERREHSYGPNV